MNFEMFTGGPGPDHPMIVPQFSLPFTLLANERGVYEVTFTNQLSAPVRVYAKAFSASAPDLWSYSVSVPNAAPGGRAYNIEHFNPGQLNGATQLWLGSWWDDGSYPETAEGVAAYFTDHPGGPEHHTVPILVG